MIDEKILEAAKYCGTGESCCDCCRSGTAYSSCAEIFAEELVRLAEECETSTLREAVEEVGATAIFNGGVTINIYPGA